MKVLLFANDLMPFASLPTSGGGLRCYQLMKGLEAHGVEVVASMPGFTFLAEQHFEKIPEPQRDLLWRWETQDAIFARVRPDAVLFASNWDHYNLSAAPEVPVIIDLHGPRVVETAMWGNPVSMDKKLRVLAGADCLLCAGRWQRSYFYGWLVQAGRVPEAGHFIRQIPVSLGPELPSHSYPGDGDDRAPYFVSGGGWFPWQNQGRAIFAACREVAARGRGTIEIYGTPHETPHASPEERAIREVYRQVRQLAEESPRIQARGYVGRDEVIGVYRRASVALEAMSYNLERELAFTTRTIEYLWCGLPVLYNDYAEVSEHIREYDAGWIVDPESDTQIAAALEEIFAEPETVRRKGGNAQRLVRDRFTWDRTILPLLEFLRDPAKAPRVRPAVGTVAVPPSYLVARGSTREVPLRLPAARLRQPVVVPADDVRGFRLPFRRADARPPGSAWRLTVRLRDERGRVLAHRLYRGSRPPSEELALDLPWFRSVRGGARLAFEVELRSRGGPGGPDAPALGSVRWLSKPVFPFLPCEAARPAGDPLDGTAEAGALAVRFTQGSGRLHRVRVGTLRGLSLARSGRWGRLLVAASRRLPRPMGRLLRGGLERLRRFGRPAGPGAARS